ncbi:hypothetical protein DERF_011327 [Dermatophagoides farinae]|uniref:Uncharacterized protein n=1 Tax=Dermatophagoides farinae TaxID=6954 RepID=A0A922HRZ9_DERFA|nr:hypothetical protein DERF_011327 [Dermatophagoides farinae]
MFDAILVFPSTLSSSSSSSSFIVSDIVILIDAIQKKNKQTNTQNIYSFAHSLQPPNHHQDLYFLKFL